jgi:hypothetical protein
MSYFTHSEDLESPFFKVQGWVNKQMPNLLNFSVQMMDHFGISIGSIAEIGVHHGRFFLCLEEHAVEGYNRDAFDVFEDQYRNLDGSGKGSLQYFIDNIQAYAKCPTLVRAFKVDSIDLRAGCTVYTNDTKYSLFSIDGCHTALHTCNDLMFAESVLVPGGIVIVDDISNMSWMGVFEGVCKYLSSPNPRLAPFAVGLNKLLMAPVGDQQRYFEYFNQHRTSLTSVTPFSGGPIVTSLSGSKVFRYSY